MFPIIKSINDFRSNVMHKEEIRESVIAENCVSFCYMISSENTFDSPELRECRGIVFNSKTGNVNARPLHKFFNVNERTSTQVQNLEWDKVTRIMDKMDGSMIHTVLLEDGVKLKSKKTFTSDVALAAQALVDSDENLTRFINDVSKEECTAIFEYTSPDARIVLYYPSPKLTLLHIRENVSGRYLTYDEISTWAAFFAVSVVVSANFDSVPYWQLGETLLNQAKVAEGIEGWIVQFENGDMVKLKTEWYLKRHHAMTFLRVRDIAVLALDEGLDDLKALLVGEGADISDILKIEEDVVQRINSISHGVNLLVEENKHLDRKDFAIKFSGNVYFGLIMEQYLGKPVNVKYFFEKNILKQEYGLRQLNLVQTVAEIE